MLTHNVTVLYQLNCVVYGVHFDVVFYGCGVIKFDCEIRINWVHPISISDSEPSWCSLVK